MLRFLKKTSVTLAVPVAHLHRLRLNNTRNRSVSTPYPCLLYLLQLQSLSTTTTTETTTKPRRRRGGSGSQSSPISSAEYLVNSLGLSPESAQTITKSKSTRLKSTKNADSILALLKDYGFTPTHITTIFSKCPTLFVYNAHTNLKPKLDFFAQNGISGDALFRILTTDPYILRTGLHSKMMPGIDLLKSLSQGQGQGCDVVSLLSAKRGTWILRHFRESTPVNVQTLRSYGVPDSIILKMITERPSFLSTDSEDFSVAVREVKEMDFDPSSMIFVRAVSTINGMKKEKLVAKFKLLKSFGWMDGQVQTLFMKHPPFFKASEEKLKIALEFFMNKLNWTVHDVSNNPAILLYSFEKRILPRSSVLEILMSKGLVEKKSIGRAYLAPEDVFLSLFVKKYEKDIPQLLMIYQNQMDSGLDS